MSDDPLLGAEVGRYRIVRAIGAGGMGRVYLGVQPEIGSRVAIKVLSERCAQDPELVERFFAEARAVNLIAHENIVNVLDLATLADGRPYIVMEYVEGVTLTRATRGGRAPLGGVVRAIADVLSAVGAAHDIGIVHRDLKPDNILVTAKGHAKVLDFGIAKLGSLPFSSGLTMTGALLGTPSYMAPEQIDGARDVDPRADLYSIGAVLFHAVTGRAPFAGATMFDIMRAQLEDPTPSPRALRPDLPLALDAVIVRALAKDPSERFATATEMAAALDAGAHALPDDQWFDLSQQTARLRVRGSGPRLRFQTPPAPLPVANPSGATQYTQATRSGRNPAPADAAACADRASRRETELLSQRAPRRMQLVLLVAGVVVAGVVGYIVASWVTSRDATPVAIAPAPPPAMTTPPSTSPPPTSAAPVPPPVSPSKTTSPATRSTASPTPPTRSPRKPTVTTTADSHSNGDSPTPPTRSPRKPTVTATADSHSNGDPRGATNLGAVTRLDVSATFERAKTLALRVPGVRVAYPLQVTIATADPERRFELAHGAFATYRFVLDPPPDEGCHLEVTFSARGIAVRSVKGACDESRMAHRWPPRCSFERVWTALLGDAQHELIREVKYDGIGWSFVKGSGWFSDDACER